MLRYDGIWQPNTRYINPSSHIQSVRNTWAWLWAGSLKISSACRGLTARTKSQQLPVYWYRSTAMTCYYVSKIRSLLLGLKNIDILFVIGKISTSWLDKLYRVCRLILCWVRQQNATKYNFNCDKKLPQRGGEP